jgi:tRNA-splicing ligase RtcB
MEGARQDLLRKSKMHKYIESSGVPIKAWTDGVPVEAEARKQLRNIAELPFVHGHIAVMPDVHLGRGATVGSVIPTKGAIIPAAVGVDIGCGMAAVMTSLTASQLPDSLKAVRADIESVIPVGQASHKQPPRRSEAAWYARHKAGYEAIEAKHPKIAEKKSASLQLGTLGGGNHFIELCLDESQRVWAMLHSGSRGVGNRIGSHYIDLAKKDMPAGPRASRRRPVVLQGRLAEHFDEYVEAVDWAQRFARTNRDLMMAAVFEALAATKLLPRFTHGEVAVNCHHNYVEREEHFGASVFVTRKGAVRAGAGELGIIPGSMGARSYIVRGKGNPESFHSCSHGAGRVMSRGEAQRKFSLADHIAATEGVECRKDPR